LLIPFGETTETAMSRVPVRFPRRARAGVLASLPLIGLVSLPLVLGRAAAAQAVDGPLQCQHVRDYIRLRIETHQLQKKMEANADQYDNVRQAFFRRRAKLLKREEWGPDAFDALRKRITRAETALDMVADSAQYRADRKQQLQTLRSRPHLTEKQKARMRAQLTRQDSVRQARIEPTRRD
jgi:hypothetical protein